MVYVWQTDSTVGSALTGTDGDLNRTYTLIHTNSIDTGINIIVSSATYQINVHFTKAGDIITFLVAIFNDQPITINYQAGVAPTNTVNTYGSEKRILYDNPAVTATITTTSTSLSPGDLTLSVLDTTGFVADDYILLEAQGNQLNEIIKISSVDSLTQFSLSSEVTYPHTYSGINITKLNYDSYKITRSDDNITYTTIVTYLLNYADQHNQINYLDMSYGASDNKYYKVYYYNSTTLVATLKAIFNNQDNFSYMTVAEFKNQTNLTGNFNEKYIAEALSSGVEYIRANAFIKLRLTGTSIGNIFHVNLQGQYINDWNADRVIDKYDVICYEYNPSTQLRTYMAHKISNLFINGPMISFNSNVPDSNQTMVIEIPVTALRYEDTYHIMAEANKLYAAYYLLGNTSVDAVKTAILSWTAGGTTVNRDSASVQAVRDKLKKDVDNMIAKMIARTYMRPTKLRSRISSLNATSSVGQTQPGMGAPGTGYAIPTFSTPGGNSYF